MVVSLPIFSALYSTVPSIFRLPAITFCDGPFFNEALSPVMNDSSKCDFPLVIVPSTAIFIPGLQIKISPFFTSSIVTSFSLFPIFKRAKLGVIVTSS